MNQRDQILDCSVQDQTGLNDFQKIPDEYGIAIPWVGIERFRFPVLVRHRDGSIMNHDAIGSMGVFLEKGKTGVNMSRFCSILQTETEPLSPALFRKILKRFQTEMRDYPTEKEIPKANLKIAFNYPLKQRSLESDNWGWQYYACELEAQIENNEFTFKTTVNYEYSSTCPCSLSMAKQYERDFADGKTTLGGGVATAHGQRSNARMTVTHEKNLAIEDIIDLLREAIPTETQSLVKRVDEQAFAILNGEYPVFVEHIVRRLSQVFDQKDFLDWEAKVEHFESLHSHNAVAVIRKRQKDDPLETKTQ